MPIYRFRIASPLTPTAASERLRAMTRTPPGVRQRFKDMLNGVKHEATPFLGRVDADRFTLQRDIRYQNSFLPQIRGRVEPDPRGSGIHIVMHLHALVALFLVFWFGMLWRFHAHGGNDAETTGVLLGMALFGIALVLVGFIPEAIKARRLLAAALAAPTKARA